MSYGRDPLNFYDNLSPATVKDGSAERRRGRKKSPKEVLTMTKEKKEYELDKVVNDYLSATKDCDEYVRQEFKPLLFELLTFPYAVSKKGRHFKKGCKAVGKRAEKTLIRRLYDAVEEIFRRQSAVNLAFCNPGITTRSTNVASTETTYPSAVYDVKSPLNGSARSMTRWLEMVWSETVVSKLRNDRMQSMTPYGGAKKMTLSVGTVDDTYLPGLESLQKGQLGGTGYRGIVSTFGHRRIGIFKAKTAANADAISRGKGRPIPGRPIPGRPIPGRPIPRGRIESILNGSSSDLREPGLSRATTTTTTASSTSSSTSEEDYGNKNILDGGGSRDYPEDFLKNGPVFDPVMLKLNKRIKGLRAETIEGFPEKTVSDDAWHRKEVEVVDFKVAIESLLGDAYEGLATIQEELDALEGQKADPLTSDKIDELQEKMMEYVSRKKLLADWVKDLNEWQGKAAAEDLRRISNKGKDKDKDKDKGKSFIGALLSDSSYDSLGRQHAYLSSSRDVSSDVSDNFGDIEFAIPDVSIDFLESYDSDDGYNDDNDDDDDDDPVGGLAMDLYPAAVDWDWVEVPGASVYP